MKYYRIHPADEPAETVLDPARPDGWTVEDEDDGTVERPYGVACCASLEDLARYCRRYSLTPQPGDRILEMEGYASPDRDRDQWAQRAIIREVVAELPISVMEGF
jgi:hypothetical protein